MPIDLDIFFVIVEIWDFHDKVESIKIPRYLTHISSDIAFLLIFMVITSFTGLLKGWNITKLVFRIFKGVPIDSPTYR